LEHYVLVLIFSLELIALVQIVSLEHYVLELIFSLELIALQLIFSLELIFF
jgi:hypothetical protein